MGHLQSKSIRKISFLITTFVILAGFGIQGHMQAASYRRSLTNHYQHAFSELAIHLSELSTSLEKSTYAGSAAMVSHLCTQSFSQAQLAQLALGELPYSDIQLSQLSTFLARTGDYTASLAWSVGQQDICSIEERETLQALTQVAQILTAQVASVQSDHFDSFSILEDLMAIESQLSAVSITQPIQEGSTYQAIEGEFPELPTLIYDGPFSQHLTGLTPTMLEGTQSVVRDEARRIASEFTGLDAQLFTLVSAGAGELPTFGFSAMVDGGELYIEVTQQGGFVRDFFHSRVSGEPTITQDEATTLACSFLESKGYWNLQETYLISQGGTVTINFAGIQDGILCYADLIKVSVALDTGMIAGFECQGYLENHQVRTFPTPVITTAQAQSTLSPLLTVLSHQLALIPSSGSYERLCHEFKCVSTDGRHVLVYINVETGFEEQILLLQEDITGTLVI